MASSPQGRLKDTEEGHRGQREGEGGNPRTHQGQSARERGLLWPSLGRQGPEAVTSPPTTPETTKLVLKINQCPNFKIGHPAGMDQWLSVGL